jgi:hypothetical protein
MSGGGLGLADGKTVARELELDGDAVVSAGAPRKSVGKRQRSPTAH